MGTVQGIQMEIPVTAGTRPEQTPRLDPRWGALYLLAPIAYAFVLIGSRTMDLHRLLAPAAYFAIGLAMMFTLIGLMRRRGLDLQWIGLMKGPGGRAILIALIGFLVGGVLWPLMEALSGMLGWSMFWDAFGGQTTQTPWAQGPAVFFFILLGPLLAAPLIEEVWFRGYLMTMLRERGIHIALSVIASGLFFGLFHLYGGPGFALWAGVWAVIPALLYAWTRDLWVPILVHLFNNVFAYMVVPVLFVGA